MVDVVLDVVEGVQRDHGHADERRRHVFRRVGREQQLLGAHGGDAGGLEADLGLEQRHGLPGALAEVAGDAPVVVAQLLQAALQALHARIFVAAAQRDVAGRLGGVDGEQRAQNRPSGLAGLGQAGGALEHAHGGGGLGGIVAAGAALQIVQVHEAVVQLAHAVAGVARVKVDVAGAALGPAGVEQPQRGAAGVVGDDQAVFRLEQLHGLLGAGTEDAVRDVGQIAEVAQALLQPPHAQASRSAGLGDVGVVGGQLSGEYGPLQIGVRRAGDGQLQIVLQQPHGVFGAGAVDAVHVVVIVFQIVQRLLDGLHGVAAAAP